MNDPGLTIVVQYDLVLHLPVPPVPGRVVLPKSPIFNVGLSC